jgi:polyhydroxybutyrate depolymerase
MRRPSRHRRGVSWLVLLATLVSVAAITLPGAPTGTGTASASDAACLSSLSPGRHVLTFDVDDTPRQVIVQVPGVAPGVRPPGIVAFHGYTAHAWQLEETSGLSAVADGQDVVVAYPEALGDPTAWRFRALSGGDRRDIAFTEAVIALLVEQACVNPDAIALAGHSMGGAMASDAACQLATHVAALILVAALWLEPQCAPGRPVPVVATHALDDPVLPYEGGPLPGLRPSGPQLMAVEEAVGSWAAHDGCGPVPLITDAVDGSAVLSWPDCAAPVVLHRLPTGGHDWPDLASRLVLDQVTAED